MQRQQLHQHQFIEISNLDHYIEPLLKYISPSFEIYTSSTNNFKIYEKVKFWRNNNNNNIACCFNCGKRESSLHMIQIPTLSRIADELIETHPFCQECIIKFKK